MAYLLDYRGDANGAERERLRAAEAATEAGDPGFAARAPDPT